MDGIYCRVSSERQTASNQFDDLIEVARRDGSGRDWEAIRQKLAACIVEERRPSTMGEERIVYRVDSSLVKELAQQCVYVEQGRSSKVGAGRRPLFEMMKRDAAAKRFDRLLAWNVSRLGRSMREVIESVYELAECGVTVFPVKSQVGPIGSTMGKLLWAIQAWYAEMENEARSEAILAGQARARAGGRQMGRPRRVFPRDQVVRLREKGQSWSQISKAVGVSVGSVRRAYHGLTHGTAACQNYSTEAL
jgi:DNA invertase Pin-like site-specific DNA recombinase